MTPSEIDAMPAGPEMDALVAEQVLHLIDASVPILRRVRLTTGHEIYTSRQLVFVPFYSTSDAAALEVLMRFDPWNVCRVHAPAKGNRPEYRTFEVHLWDDADKEAASKGNAPTLALAICRAALKAVYQGAGPQP